MNVVEANAVLKTFEALMGADDAEISDAFLMAALYSSAIRSDRAPRDVLDAVWKSMPSTESWPALRVALLSMLEDETGG